MKIFSQLSPVSRILRSACMAALGGVAVSSAHAKFKQMLPTDKGSGIGIEVSSDFDEMPPSGTVPLHITIHNNSNRTGTWLFEANCVGYPMGNQRPGSSTSLSVTVGAGQSSVVPMTGLLTINRSYRNFRFSAIGPGVHGDNVNFPGSSTGGRKVSQFLAMSRDLSARSLESLKQQVDSSAQASKSPRSGDFFSGTAFDSYNLPADWRGYVGIEWLAFTELEWTKLAPDVRSGIRQWVAHGGHLVVATRDAAKMDWSDFHLTQGTEPIPYGFGDIRALVWDGKELNPDALEPLITKGNAQCERWELPEAKGWPMLAALGDLKTNKPLILGFVLLFAALVGPVNLFVLAPARQRSRLFWTTPLLSLGGSVLLMTLIFLQEGMGGTGRRFTLIRLLPETHEGLVVQDQVTRTGLLIGSGFNLNEDVFALQLPLDGRQIRGNSLDVEGRAFSGDWFRSRSLQAQRLTSIRSTRAALEIVGHDPSGAPMVVSSIESPLETVVMTDEKGKFWRADNVRTGEKVTLRSVERNEWSAWWDNAIQPARASMRDLLKEESGSSGKTSSATFRATVAQSKEDPVATLPSIRWKEDHVVYVGPVTQLTQTGGSQQ